MDISQKIIAVSTTEQMSSQLKQLVAIPGDPDRG